MSGDVYSDKERKKNTFINAYGSSAKYRALCNKAQFEIITVYAEHRSEQGLGFKRNRVGTILSHFHQSLIKDYDTYFLDKLQQGLSKKF